MASSVTSLLGSGSGIDTKALVTQLVSASYDPKLAALKKREETNAARISTLATLSSGIDSFSSALTSLIAGGTLQTQPTSSDATVLTATARTGARIGDFSAKIEVSQLAQAQTLASVPLTGGATAAVGLGKLTLATPAGDATITIDQTNNSLAGLARAINDAKKGVTASVVTDTTGARLVLRGQTGAANDFKLLDAGADGDLARFAWNGTPAAGGMTRPQEAKDALLKVDGVDVARASNTVSDIVDGITFNLVSAKPGTTVSIGAQRPTEAIAQAMTDFVSAYNALKTELNTATARTGDTSGPFAGNSSIKAIQRQLAGLTSTVLNSAGGPSTLAEIGVSTQRDGTLTFDRKRLDTQMASNPDGVEALFNPTQYSSSSLIKITSALGAAKPGTYTLANVVAGSNSASATGTIDGKTGVGTGTRLAASVTSGAYGLVIEPQGDVASATVSIDPGLGGAMEALRDILQDKTLNKEGVFENTRKTLTADTKRLVTQRDQLERQQESYKDQLTKQFGTMDARVNAFKATQTYLSQQISIWTKSND